MNQFKTFFKLFHKVHALLFIVLALMSSCARNLKIERDEALIKTSPPENFFDDSPLKNLILALKENIEHISNHEINYSEYNFQGKVYSKEEYLTALQLIVDFYQQLEGDSEQDQKTLQFIKKSFDFYRPYGREDGESFITSYYWPQIKGELKPTGNFTTPLYSAPDDLVTISLGKWTKNRPNWNKDELPNKLYGRLTLNEGRLPTYKVIPFADRKEIDVDGALFGQNLEICYVDPIDAFFIQIQGHGSIKLSSGEEIHVGYAAQNGHPYESIGKFVSDQIPLEELTLDSLESYLRSLPPEKYQEIFNKNPSYVFFKKMEETPHTTLGTGVIEGRTLASDPKYFPKGALGFLQFTFPLDRTQTDSKKHTVSRLFFDQDTGGAIKGPGRFDFYWGKGKDAKDFAGKVKNKANVYYLAPNNKTLEKIKHINLQSIMTSI